MAASKHHGTRTLKERLSKELLHISYAKLSYDQVAVIIGSNSGEGILNSGKYIKDPELLDSEFSNEEYWDSEMGPFFIFDR